MNSACQHCGCSFSYTDNQGKESCMGCGKKWLKKKKGNKKDE